MDIEILSKRYSNLTKNERDVLYSLKDDPSIIVKGTDKGSVVVVWGRENYLKEAHKHYREVYDEVTSYPNVLINTIMKALEKIHLPIRLFLTLQVTFLKNYFCPKMLLKTGCLTVFERTLDFLVFK